MEGRRDAIPKPAPNYVIMVKELGTPVDILATISQNSSWEIWMSQKIISLEQDTALPSILD